jgi:serine/threonine-protein kinase RsbW
MPCRAEYIGVARLAILGVASRMSFSYDKVEDLRLAVGEACTGAVERAKAVDVCDGTIEICCTMRDDSLSVEVVDNVAPLAGEDGKAVLPEPTEEQSISALLMEILVDEIQTEGNASLGTTVRMVKYLDQSE